MSSWQMARNRRAFPQRYEQHLAELLPSVLLRYEADAGRGRSTRARPKVKVGPSKKQRTQRVVVMVVGSERGLCGGYNKMLVGCLQAAMRERYAAGATVEIMGLGSRAIRELRSAGYVLSWTGTLSMTAVPNYASALAAVTEWLRRYEDYAIDAVDVIYNSDRGTGTYEPTVTRLIPTELPVGCGAGADSIPGGDIERWRDVIVETDAASLYDRIIEQWTANAYYRILLDAASTEHAARYQLMESATQNADALSAELMLAIQSARRQAITREMQELAVGAGLLGG